MENNSITYPTYEQIATLLSNLATNYSSIAENFVTIFYDTTPKDVTFKMYDKNGSLITYTIPNRAKDFRYIQNGEGQPEGVVAAPKGTLYQDTLNGNIYLKKVLSTDPTIGWYLLDTPIKGLLIGSGDPNGVIEGSLGSLYINTSNFTLYVKSVDGGNNGWIFLVPPFDTVPTENSTNGITSGAVYTAISDINSVIGDIETLLSQI